MLLCGFGFVAPLRGTLGQQHLWVWLVPTNEMGQLLGHIKLTLAALALPFQCSEKAPDLMVSTGLSDFEWLKDTAADTNALWDSCQ